MSPRGFSAQSDNRRFVDAAPKLREAIALHERGRIAEAEQQYREILGRFPDHPDALHFLGVIESQRGRHDKAIELMDRSLALRPSNPAAQYNRANTLRDAGRLDDALLGYDATLALHGGHASALMNKAALLGSLDRTAEALEAYDRALAIASQNANAHCGRGRALSTLNRFDEAILAFGRAIALSPGDTQFLIARGHTLCRAGRHTDGLADFERAVAGNPRNADAFAGRAVTCMELRRFTDAIDSYDHALKLEPDRIELQYGRGSALIELGRHDEAIAGFERLLATKPDYPYALGMLVHARKTSCDWSNATAEAEMVRRVRNGERVASPFALLPVSDSPADMQQCARILMRDRFEAGREALSRNQAYRHERIRIAYVSADLRAHPVGYLIAGVIEAHDRTRFEVTGIAYTDDDNSELRQRLKRGFDRFIETGRMSDFEIARAMREMEIDIAVDLTGLTASCRPGILSFRPAPIQVNYLGYAGSMGTSRFDYIIGDSTVIPDAHEAFYDEKIARLPVPFMAVEPITGMRVNKPSRTAAGLPERGFVFASFNNSYKFSPVVFSIWMRLLHATPESVLWLAGSNAHAERNLKSEAQKRGIAADRILFAQRLPRIDDHLARVGLADLFLDTTPYNAHSTAADALRAGVPLLTCRGESFAGRVAASLLQGAGLLELITMSLTDYEARALELVQNSPALAAIRAKLHDWNEALAQSGIGPFVRNLESAYRQMWTRAQTSLPPMSFNAEGML